jgi:hypothetical protein
MSAGFKFDWFKAVHADTRIPGGEKAVLGYIAIVYVLTGHDTFCVRQSTLAEHCSTSRRTVGSAITRAKALGYLAMSRERTPGRTHHGADELRLLLPESCEESSPHSEESCEDSSPHSDLNGGKQTSESCEADDAIGGKELREWCEEANALISGNNTPNSSLNSSLINSSLREWASPRPPAQARPSPPTPKNQPPPKTKQPDLNGPSPAALQALRESMARGRAQRKNRPEGDGR